MAEVSQSSQFCSHFNNPALNESQHPVGSTIFSVFTELTSILESFEYIALHFSHSVTITFSNELITSSSLNQVILA